jgi:hypothetical protein
MKNIIIKFNFSFSFFYPSLGIDPFFYPSLEIDPYFLIDPENACVLYLCFLIDPENACVL